MKLIPFVPEHLHELNISSEPDIKINPELYLNGPAWTAICDEGIIGCAGLDMTVEGTATAWAIFTPLFAKHYFTVHKGILRSLIVLKKQYNINRIQAWVDADNESAVKWALMLGFEKEGLCRKFYKGKDYWMVAML